MIDLLYACLILLPLGFSLRMSLRLLYGARGPRLEDPVAQVMNVLGWSLILLPLLVFLVVGTNFLCWILLLIALTAVVEVVLARRDLQRRGVWSLLSGLSSGQQPLPDTLLLHRDRFTGIVGRAFRKLVDALEQGLDLRTAISLNRDAVPREALAFAAIDAISATPSPAADPGLHSTSAELSPAEPVDSPLTPAWQHIFQHLTYLATVLMIMIGILTFIMLTIVPSYQAIFDDFELDLPDVTIWLITLTNWLVNTGLGLLIALGCIVGMLLGILIVVLYMCDIPVLRPLGDKLFFSWHRALVLRLLAVAAERGQPFSTVLSELTCDPTRYPSRFVWRRLEQVNRLLSAGHDWKEALCKKSFLQRADIPLLETAQQAGNLPWVLRMLADQKERLLLFRWSAFEQIAFPIAVVLMGMVVGFICVALFVPLVNLINGLA